jgi:hypothetical protein
MKTPASRAVILACILIGVLAFVTPSAAQFYKWTDAAGTVHFSDNPPPRAAGAKVEVVPETHYRPPTVRRAAPPEEPAPPEPVAESPPEPEISEDASDYGTEPMGEDVGADVPIVDDTAGDPAVRWRANSPRNRPGQPIRSAPRRR